MTDEYLHTRLKPKVPRVTYVNFWTRRRARLDTLIEDSNANVTPVNTDLPDSMFSLPEPNVAVVGFAVGSREAATFLANYRASDWFRRVPLIGLLDSRDDGPLQYCMEWGCDDVLLRPIRRDRLSARIRIWSMRGEVREEERRVADLAARNFKRAAEFSELIVPLGVAMMAEDELEVLLEMVLDAAREFSNADGGTIYLVSEKDELDFKILANASLGMEFGAKNKGARPLASVPLNSADEKPMQMACHVAVTGDTLNIPDVYSESRFDLSGVREFDGKTGYTTRSVLTIALRDHENHVIGVLQLINALDPATGEAVPFDDLTRSLIESLSLLAGQALESYRQMERLRKERGGLTIDIDEEERSKQVDAIVSSDYFRELKARANALRDVPSTGETATT